jgi:hypothetical protein
MSSSQYILACLHRTSPLIPLPCRSLRPLFLSLLPGSQKELEKLRKTRESLANELSEVIS